MEEAVRRPGAAQAALAYAGLSALVLAVLPHLEGPLRALGARHAGAVLLGRYPARGVLWGLAAGAALAAASHAVTRWTPWGRRLARLLARALGPLHPADALLLAALSGLGEELLFRGVALPYLGLVASSALFGLAHLVPRAGLWAWSLWAGAVGLLLGWLALWTGGLLAPTVAHAAVNALGLLLVGRRARAGAPDAS